MLNMFREGGWGMIPTAICGLLLLAVAIRGAISPSEGSLPRQISLGVLTLTFGGLGFVTGLMKSVSFIQEVGEDKRWIWLVGLGESLNNLVLALGLVALAAIVTSVAMVRAPARA